MGTEPDPTRFTDLHLRFGTNLGDPTGQILNMDIRNIVIHAVSGDYEDAGYGTCSGGCGTTYSEGTLPNYYTNLGDLDLTRAGCREKCTEIADCVGYNYNSNMNCHVYFASDTTRNANVASFPGWSSSGSSGCGTSCCNNVVGFGSINDYFNIGDSRCYKKK